MPSENGELSLEERQKFADWLNGKSAGRGGIVCPICGGKSFGIIPHTMQLMPFTPRVGLNVGGPVYPLVGISCESCSHVLTFMALQVGIVKNG